MLEDRFYEAAFLPELWPEALDGLARLIDAEGALLTNVSLPGSPWFASPGVAQLYRDYFEGGWGFDNGRTQTLVRVPHAGFISDAAHISPDGMAREPVYRDFLWTRDFGYAAGTVIPLPTGDVIGISVDRKRARGPVLGEELVRLDQVRPHLARAAMVASRLQFSRIEGALEALGLAQIPAAMLRSDGRLLQANAPFERLHPQLGISARGGLLLNAAGAQALFDRAIALAALGEHRSQVQSLPLPGSPTLSPILLHLVPIRGAARDLFVNAGMLVIATPLSRANASLQADVIQGLFDLTPGEARVAGLIANGQTIRDAARSLEVSVETIRSHVKAFLGKAGMRSQTEFIATMSAVRPIRDDPASADRLN